MEMILEYNANVDKALTSSKNMMACLTPMGKDYYTAKLQYKDRYTSKADICNPFIMMVENYTRKIEGFGKHADNLLLNKVSIKKFLIRHDWTETNMTGEWVTNVHGEHMFGHITGNELKYIKGVSILPDHGVYIGLFDEDGEPCAGGGEI